MMCTPLPNGIGVPSWARDNPQMRTVMSEIITVGLDMEKNVFHLGAVAA